MSIIELLILDGANAAFGGADSPSLSRLDAVRVELSRAFPGVPQEVVFDYSMRYKLPQCERSAYRKRLKMRGFWEVEQGTSADPEIIKIARGDATRRVVVSRDTFQDEETNQHVFRGLRVLPFQVDESESSIRVMLGKLRVYQSSREWVHKRLAALSPALSKPKEAKPETGPDPSTVEGARALRFRLSESRRMALNSLEEKIARGLLDAGGSQHFSLYETALERDFSLLAFRAVLRGSTDPLGVFLRSSMFLALSEDGIALELTEFGRRYLGESDRLAQVAQAEADHNSSPESLRAALEAALDKHRGTIRVPNLIDVIQEMCHLLPHDDRQLLNAGAQAVLAWIKKQDGLDVTFSRPLGCFVVKRGK